MENNSHDSTQERQTKVLLFCRKLDTPGQNTFIHKILNQPWDLYGTNSHVFGIILVPHTKSVVWPFLRNPFFLVFGQLEQCGTSVSKCLNGSNGEAFLSPLLIGILSPETLSLYLVNNSRETMSPPYYLQNAETISFYQVKTQMGIMSSY